MKNKQAKFDLDSLNKAVNISRLSGINYIDRTGIEATETKPAGDLIFGYGSNGYKAYFLNGDVSPEKKEDIMRIVSNAIGSKRCLPLPYKGKLSVDIIGEMFISSKTGNLIITSIAPNVVLFVANSEEYKDLELLLADLSKALVAVSNGEKSDFNWETYQL